ncbi:MAG TPA: hypothetical protein VIH99_12355 [Bdellovibrionota bacterium]|jgi:hypothetical protein
MKCFFALLALALFASAPASAKEETWKLKCKWDREISQPSPALKLSVEKYKFRNRDTGKREVEYSIVVRLKNVDEEPVVLKLEPAGSGDDDYSEYRLVDRTSRLPIQGAYIHEDFEWARVIDSDGYGSYGCK